MILNMFALTEGFFTTKNAKTINWAKKAHSSLELKRTATVIFGSFCCTTVGRGVVYDFLELQNSRGYHCSQAAAIEQSVYRLAMGWTTEESEFESR
jgi:hypothetical protein